MKTRLGIFIGAPFGNYQLLETIQAICWDRGRPARNERERDIDLKS
jgi:hypothetical protein